MIPSPPPADPFGSAPTGRATSDAPLRIAIVDDQPLIRAGFAMVVDSQPDMEVVLQAGDGAEAVDVLRGRLVDIILMDVRMPVMDGIDATRRVLAQAGSVPPRVIMLTTFDIDEYVLAAVRAGASGFLLKDAQPEELLSAIRTVQRGDAVIAPSATKRLLGRLIAQEEAPARPENPGLAQLTEREREVLVLIGRGRTNHEIAAELFVAEATVKTHVGRVLAKLGARDRVQAVIIAFESGLVSPGD